MIPKTILSANPRAGYLSHKAEIDKVVLEAMESGWYILGRAVSSFEEEFSRCMGVGYGIGVANGTDALLLAIKACGIGPGDAVVTVSHTAVATVAAVVLSGARPVLVDIDENTFTIDPERLESTLRAHPELNIKAIIPVHIYGHPADMSAVCSLAKKYGLYVIEDCAQAHGAMSAGRKVGSIGTLGAFSFYPTKNLAALGDGGAIVTEDKQLYERVKMLRQYGWRERYISEIAGMNSRLDELQAAILKVKLKYLDEDNLMRRNIAKQYSDLLAGGGFKLPIEKSGYYHVYHQYLLRVAERDSLKKYLEERNIGTSILYPQPVHLQQGYSKLIYEGAGGLKITEMVSKDLLCLPIYPGLRETDVSYVCGQILEWAARK